MGLKIKSFNIMGVTNFLGEGVIKKQYIGGITQKGGGIFLREG